MPGSSVITAGPRRHRDRIAVVGGGIGGLAAAAFLRRAGLAATVYEQASALGEVGAGLVVAPNAARLLRRLPSELGLGRAGVVLETGWEFRRWAEVRGRGPAQPQRLALWLRRRAGRRGRDACRVSFSIGSAPHRDPGSTPVAFASG